MIPGFAGVPLAVDCVGAGPLVLFVHGFPELRSSWHRQMPAVAAAGYTAAALDTRGNGESGQPPLASDYRMEAMTADLAAVAHALAPGQPVTLVGHDWGAAIVWHAALAYPHFFTRIAALSVPWTGLPERPAIDLFDERFTAKNRFFYQAYFQEEGVAEAELEADVALFLRAFYHGISGEAQPGDWPNRKAADARLLDGMAQPAALPNFVDPAYFAQAVRQFERTGFRGALNRYRNHRIDFDWVRQFDGVVRQDALFIGGTADPAFILSGGDPMAAMKAHVPQLSAHLLEGCGHWTQAERSDAVTTLLLDWLGKPPAS